MRKEVPSGRMFHLTMARQEVDTWDMTIHLTVQDASRSSDRPEDDEHVVIGGARCGPVLPAGQNVVSASDA